MVGGMSRVTHDVPPYTIGGGVPYKMGGLNMVGLKRRGFSFETRKALGHAFKILYRSGFHFKEALEEIRGIQEMTPEVKLFLDFCLASERGVIGLQGVAGRKDTANT